MAYRFNGTSDRVEFASPLGAGSLSAFTIAYYLKRNATLSGTDSPLAMVAEPLTAYRWELEWNSFDGTLRTATNGFSNVSWYNGKSFAYTSAWSLVVVTWSGTGITRLHWNDVGTWNHAAGTNGTAAATAIAADDRIWVSGPSALNRFLQADVACVGIKMSDMSDAAIETLSRTLWANWVDFGFDWLIGFADSPSLEDRGAIGTGDELSRTGTTLVSDPPSWSWAIERIDSATATLAHTPLVDEIYNQEYNEFGTATLALTPSAIEVKAHDHTDTATARLALTPSALDAYGSTDAATAALVFLPITTKEVICLFRITAVGYASNKWMSGTQSGFYSLQQDSHYVGVLSEHPTVDPC